MDIKILNEDYKFKVRVSGIIIIDNKLLTTKYGEKEIYCLPGGYVEIGETTEFAIKRELKEELQIEIKVDSFLGITENFFTNLRKERTHGLDFYYKVSPKRMTDINLDDYEFIEIDKGHKVHHHFKWINVEELDNYDFRPSSIKDIIKDQRFSTIFHLIENK